MDFLEIFTSGRYHRDMKILKILASNSKQLKNDKLMMIGGQGGGGGVLTKYNNFLDNFYLK